MGGVRRDLLGNSAFDQAILLKLLNDPLVAGAEGALPLLIVVPAAGVRTN